MLATAALVMGAGAAQAMPDLGQQRTITSRPGSGLVRSTGRPKPRRDSARQAAAQAKRERKNAKRLRDFMNRHDREIWRCGNPHCFPFGVSHGK